jgi:hypothetical protein
MSQLTQLGHDIHRERLARAEAQRPAQCLLALARATRRARIRRPAPRPGRCLEPTTASPANTPKAP